MHVLIIGFVWPEPCSSAAGSRMLELIDAFRSAHWKVTFASAAQASGHQADLDGRGVTCQSITLNSGSFDEFVTELQPDVVVFDRFMIEEQFGWRVAQACPTALRVLDTEDLHSLRKARRNRLREALRNAGSGLERDAAIATCMAAEPVALFRAMVAEEISYREIAAIQRCDLTLMISEFEISLLVRFFGVARSKLHYCPFMLPQVPLPQDDFSRREHFVSLGNFRHEPNWDAVLWLKERLWPSIRAVLPQTELHIYGAYPPPKATALSSHQDGFIVKGWAADAGQVLSGARVCLAPLRFGAGIKGKLAQAMAVGTPSVTTPVGAEAMRSPDLPWPGVVAAEAGALIAGAIDLYSNAERWRQAQLDGVALYNQRFSRHSHRGALLNKLQQSAQSLAEVRANDFTGAMLRHHAHQSTRYMSKWIETKALLQAAVTG